MITAKEIADAGLTRLQFAHALGISYTSLCNKMGGFSAWIGDELERGRTILAAKATENAA